MMFALLISWAISAQAFGQVQTFDPREHCVAERQAMTDLMDAELPKFRAELDAMDVQRGEGFKVAAMRGYDRQRLCCPPAPNACGSGSAYVGIGHKSGGILGAQESLIQGVVDGMNALRIASFVCEDAAKNERTSLGESLWPEEAKARGLPASYEKFSKTDLKNARIRLSHCLEEKATSMESEARKISAQAGQVTETKDSAPGLSCLEKNTRRPRLCFTSFSSRMAEKIDDPSASGTARELGSVKLTSNNQTCSGNVLGDNQTVVTAGHCFVGAESAMGKVVDKHGVAHNVNLKCGPGRNDSDNDVRLCAIQDAKIEASPLYLVTKDTSMTGEKCVPTDYVLRCPAGAFSRHDLTAETFTYPGGENVSARGKVVVGAYPDSPNKVFYDSYTSTGSSGGGIVANFQGYRAIVAPVASGPANNPLNTEGHITYFQDVKALRVQSLDQKQVADGAFIMLKLGAEED